MKNESKTVVVSYSLTGNNDALATNLAAAFAAAHLKISESTPRAMGTIALDMLFNRTPAVEPSTDKINGYGLVIFVAPVWMGKVATPLRAYLKFIKSNQIPYAFVSISGGSDGVNPGLAGDLKKRTGKEPKALIDLHIADLLPKGTKPTREATSAYLITDADVKLLTEKAVALLREVISPDLAEAVY